MLFAKRQAKLQWRMQLMASARAEVIALGEAISGDNCFIDSISQGVEQEYNDTLTCNFNAIVSTDCPYAYVVGCSWPW